MPSMLTPNQEKLVTMLPKTAIAIRPRSLIIPPQRACRMIAFQSTISSAPFSFGSQPQNRPQDWSAQIPPRIVPTKLNKRGEADDAVNHRVSVCADSGVERRVKNPRTI